MNVLVTGSNGFIGRNLLVWLAQLDAQQVLTVDKDTHPDEFEYCLSRADWVFHLAGINRPENDEEYRSGNVDLTRYVCERLSARRAAIPVTLTSSVQAELDNPYGQSKRDAEEVVKGYGAATGAPVMIYRLSNVFGKWCQPHYNSVVATFCHQVARDLPVMVSDPERVLELVYIDDVIREFVALLGRAANSAGIYGSVTPVYKMTLSGLLALLQSFREGRRSLFAPDAEDPLVRKLYATYVSHLPPEGFAYSLPARPDARGTLAEFMKVPNAGQFFVSRTKPGVTRGEHYHNTKVEKFLVLEGEAIVRFRIVDGKEIIEHRIRGEELRPIDIPVGYAHSIQNTGSSELVTLFWANEEFDPQHPDTFSAAVVRPQI